MIMRIARALALTIVVSTSAHTQHGGGASSVRVAPPEAKQFAFLVGQFELEVKPAASGLAQRMHGVPKLIGIWRAWRALDGFGIEDELRITDEAGNPKSLTHAVRFYDADAKRWKATTIDAYRGVFTSSTSQWREKEMVSTAAGNDADGRGYVARGRYYDITPNSFTFRQERSYDEGRTWEEPTLTIAAKRVAASASRQ